MYILDLILENILNSYCKPCLILYHKLLINIIIFITSFFYGLSFSRLYTFRFGILYQIWQMKKQLLIWRMLTGLHCQLRRNKIILLHLYFCTCFPGGGGHVCPVQCEKPTMFVGKPTMFCKWMYFINIGNNVLFH